MRQPFLRLSRRGASAGSLLLREPLHVRIRVSMRASVSVSVSITRREVRYSISVHSPGEEPRNVVVAALSRLQGRLAAFVRARVPAEDVEDLLQNAAARAAESATSLKSADGLEPWLFRIHRNAITDRLRHRASEVRALQRLAELVGSAISPESSPCACSLKLARDLPQRLAEILVHVDVQGEGVAETAKALGISNNNAAVRLHRARSALRARLREHCGVTTARDCASCVCGERGCCD